MNDSNDSLKKIEELQEQIFNAKNMMENHVKKIDKFPELYIFDRENITRQQIDLIRLFIKTLFLMNKSSTEKIVTQLNIKELFNKSLNQKNLSNKRNFSNRYL